MKDSGSGIVFDIHRFSLNDGPGIRTTVFLKGCPLHCDWCHNPESQSFEPQLSFNPDKCVDCFDCVKVCPTNTHQVINNKHVVVWNNCTASGECIKACTHEALKIIGLETRVDEIIAEVVKDRAYYEKSGGGLTISGGEPLAQFEFTKALLLAAKNEGIHTCIDTCGIASKEKYKEILPLTGLFLYDYKITDSKKHKEITGAQNRQVLENLKLLIENGANVVLRCPVVPGINDDDEHLNGIAKLMTKYPELLSVEILPYHSMGRDKSSFIGKEYKLRSLQDATKEDKEKWLKYFSEHIESKNKLILK